MKRRVRLIKDQYMEGKTNKAELYEVIPNMIQAYSVRPVGAVLFLVNVCSI